MGLFLAFYLVPLVYISVFVPVPYCLDDCSFVVSSGVRKVDFSSFILSQDCFGYSGSFVYPCELWIFLFSVHFSCSVVSDSLWPQELQDARPPCPSPTPGVYWNSCPLTQWCHPAISSSVIPFISCPQPLQASGSFPVSQFFTSCAKVLEFQLQHQSFQWTLRTNLL